MEGGVEKRADEPVVETLEPKKRVCVCLCLASRLVALKPHGIMVVVLLVPMRSPPTTGELTFCRTSGTTLTHHQQ